MRTVGVIARMTFHEAVRKKLLLMALVGGAAFLTLFGIALHFQAQSLPADLPALVRRHAFGNLQMVGMYAVNFMIVAITVLASVDTLSGEIGSGAIQAIATKPIARWQLVAGKWLGFCALLTVYSLAMILGAHAITRAITGVGVRHLAAAFGLMWMESMLLLSATLFFSVLFSTLTTGVTVLGLHGIAFLAGWIEQAGSLTHTPKAVLAGVAASLLMPSEALWRRAAFEIQSPLMNALSVSPFGAASVPSAAMIGYAAAYTAAMFFLAVAALNRRDL